MVYVICFKGLNVLGPFYFPVCRQRNNCQKELFYPELPVPYFRYILKVWISTYNPIQSHFGASTRLMLTVGEVL